MTHGLFWALPGPRRFSDALLTDLGQARSTVVRLPAIGVPGFGPCLQHALAQSGLPCRITETTEGSNACEQILLGLGHTMGLETPQNAIRKACSGGQRVLAVTGIGPGEWLAWRSALMIFSHLAAHVPQSERATLVLVLIGPDYRNTVCTDGAMQYREWQGVISSSDALCLADHLLPMREGKPRIREILIHTLASVAMWDHGLLKHLAGQPPRTILAPSAALAAYAGGKGWNGNTREDVWLGTAGEYEGRQVTHTALSVARGTKGAVERALWRAQVRVLLPWVENERLDVVEQLVASGRARPSDVSREIGELFSLHANDRRVKRGLQDRIKRLRQVRNELAHGRNLSREAILNA